MIKTLHILSSCKDDLADQMMERESGLSVVHESSPNPDSKEVQKVVVIDLTISNPDYRRLTQAIFEAETVAVW